MRDVSSLPASYAGLNIGNVSEYSQREYDNSVRMNSQLIPAKVNQSTVLTINQIKIDRPKFHIGSEVLTGEEENHERDTRCIVSSTARTYLNQECHAS